MGESVKVKHLWRVACKQRDDSPVPVSDYRAFVTTDTMSSDSVVSVLEKTIGARNGDFLPIQIVDLSYKGTVSAGECGEETGQRKVRDRHTVQTAMEVVRVLGSHGVSVKSLTDAERACYDAAIDVVTKQLKGNA